jgi:hypothetical protein
MLRESSSTSMAAFMRQTSLCWQLIHRLSLARVERIWASVFIVFS